MKSSTVPKSGPPFLSVVSRGPGTWVVGRLESGPVPSLNFRKSIEEEPLCLSLEESCVGQGMVRRSFRTITKEIGVIQNGLFSRNYRGRMGGVPNLMNFAEKPLQSSNYLRY